MLFHITTAFRLAQFIGSMNTVYDSTAGTKETAVNTTESNIGAVSQQTKGAINYASVTFYRYYLEKVAINNALPLKAARCDAIANLKSFWAPSTPVTIPPN